MTWHTEPPSVFRPFIRWLDRWIPQNPELRRRLRTLVFRVLALTTIALGLYYFSYRYTRSLNLNALWFAIPLLLAETYSFIGSLLFILTLWKPAYRRPIPPPKGVTVDVFITTYNEPLDVIRRTVEAALNIRYPHQTYVLDDGNRPEVRELCRKLRCGYIVRGPEWEGRPRHAKAGNINNALMQTTGEFILFLDADQIPAPSFLDQVLGYFRDPKVAFVQTPQYFYNVPPQDPFANQAPLFYGPILQGKDGWNAAFFCGTNAVMRREALMHLGVLRYVQLVEQRVLEVLSRLALDLRTGRRALPRRYRRHARRVSQATEEALQALRRGEPLGEILTRFHIAIQTIRREIVLGDLQDIVRALSDIESIPGQPMDSSYTTLAPTNEAPGARVMDMKVVRDVRQAIERRLDALSSDLVGIATPSAETMGLDSDMEQLLALEIGEALDVQPMDTLTVTEDMATALQLHALGWKSVFHPEILAYGLAPEDLESALRQRFRWAVGTLQVFLHYNPLTMPGLTWGQRLQYFMTIYSYFSGFASLVYLVSPIIYLLTGIPPVTSFASEFLIRIAPYLTFNWLMFQFASWGMRTFRGEQYNLALFPIWIQAVLAVFGGQRIQFQVTPKVRRSGVYITLIWPQLAIIVLQVLSGLYAVGAVLLGWRHDVAGIVINLFWIAYDLFMLYPLLPASVHRSEGTYRPPLETFS